MSTLRTALLCTMGVTLLSTAAIGGDRATAQSAGETEVKTMDRNRDAKLSAAEHEAGAKAMFLAMDGDKDQTVTATEMAAYQHAKAPDQRSANEMSPAAKIKVIDANGDGALSAEEHAAGARSMFDKMDADGNGSLTAAEIDAGHASMMKRTS